MSKTLQRKIRIRTTKTADFEELLPREEAAIEEGRRAYVSGEWISLNKLKNGMGRPHHKTRTKKS